MSGFDLNTNAYERQHQHVFRAIVIGLVLVAIAILLYILWRDVQDSKVVLQSSQGVLRSVTEEPPTYFENGYFRFTAPSGWEEVPHDRARNNRYIAYYFRGGTQEDTGRSLEVYVDALPPGLSFNRVVLVTTHDDPSTLRYVKISSTCYDYLPQGPVDIREETAVTWEETTFMCNPSEARNVIGAIIYHDGQGVNLTGVGGGTHHYLLVYTDHTSQPQNSFFIEIINSFQAL